jgi:hypothetical protein
MSSQPQNWAAVHHTMFTQTVIEVQPPRYIFNYGDTQNPYNIQLQLKLKRHVTNTFFMLSSQLESPRDH